MEGAALSRADFVIERYDGKTRQMTRRWKVKGESMSLMYDLQADQPIITIPTEPTATRMSVSTLKRLKCWWLPCDKVFFEGGNGDVLFGGDDNLRNMKLQRYSVFLHLSSSPSYLPT